MTTVMVIDVETTGMEPSDKMVEFAAVNMNFNPGYSLDPAHLDCGTSLINPCIPIPPEAMAVHHITDKMVHGATLDPAIAIMDAMGAAEIIDPDILAAHNAKFDRQYLDPYFAPDARWICTYKVAHHLYPDAPNHKNATLFYYLDLHKTDAVVLTESMLHRALPDAQITAAILGVMARQITLDEMVEISSKPVRLHKVPVGKYYGQSFEKVDDWYLKNMFLNPEKDFSEDIVYTARLEFVRRGQGDQHSLSLGDKYGKR